MPSRRTSSRPILFRLTLVALAAACARPPEPSFEGGQSLDLALLLPAAGALVETAAIDAGTPAGRPSLASGFGPDESAGETTFAWGMGEASEVRFTVVEPRDLKARLRGWSYPFEDGRGQRVTVVLNGTTLGELALAAAPETLAVDLLAAALRVGENRLELQYERFFDSGSGRNRRALAAAWDGFRFEPLEAAAPPSVEATTGALRVPWRSGLEVPLELPEGGAVVWAWIDTGGRGSLAIDIVAEGEAAPGDGIRFGAGAGRLEDRKSVV